MQAAVKMLNELSYLERFAWFAVLWSSVQPASNLFGESGSITPKGLGTQLFERDSMASLTRDSIIHVR